MTLEEYAKTVGNALRNAHNAKSMSEIAATFQEADKNLIENKISENGQIIFWSNVRKAMNSGSWYTEEQANSSLVALMQAIQQGLAKRECKK